MTRNERINQVALPRYRAVEAGMVGDMRGAVAAYQAGQIPRAEVERWFGRRMSQAQADAFVAGRIERRNGMENRPVSDAEARMLVNRLDAQARYFRRFLDDIDAGRGRLDYGARAELYGNSLWGTYQRGATVDWDEPDTARFYHWILDPDAEHCLDCRKLAERSMRQGGFTWEEMEEIGWPGEAQTECLVNCRCHIRVEKRRRRVLPPEGSGGEPSPPAPSPSEGRGGSSSADLLRGLMRQAGMETPGAMDLPGAFAAPGGGVGLPAAGVPFAVLSPDAVAGLDAPAAARALDAIPRLLTHPGDVVPLAPGREGEVRREYAGYGWLAVLARRDGTWAVDSVRRDDRQPPRRFTHRGILYTTSPSAPKTVDDLERILASTKAPVPPRLRIESVEDWERLVGGRVETPQCPADIGNGGYRKFLSSDDASRLGTIAPLIRPTLENPALITDQGGSDRHDGRRVFYRKFGEGKSVCLVVVAVIDGRVAGMITSYKLSTKEILRRIWEKGEKVETKALDKADDGKDSNLALTARSRTGLADFSLVLEDTPEAREMMRDLAGLIGGGRE